MTAEETYNGCRYATGGNDFTDLIVDRTRNFTGRRWIFAEVEGWLGDPNGERTFFLTGGPGSGKTSLAARLVQLALGEPPTDLCPHLAQDGLAYYHFCQAQYNAVIDPLVFVKALSLALAERYPTFAFALTQIGQRRPEIHIQQTVGQATASEITAVKIETLEVGGLSAKRAFATLVVEPLTALTQSVQTGPVVVLIDALDEALTFDPDENLVTLLADVTDDPRDLPKQLRFLITSRPDPRVLELAGKLQVDLVDDTPASQHDVVDYVEARLAPVLADRTARRHLAGRIAAEGAGNFLYARYVLDDFVRHPADSATLALPPGLDGVYAGFLKRELGRQGATWRTYRPLFGALTVARGVGLTRRQLAGITAQPTSAVDEILEPCMQYLAGTYPDGPFHIYHQSFRDFLLRDPKYQVYPGEANERIATYFIEECGEDWPKHADDYALHYTLLHLLEIVRLAEQRSQRAEVFEQIERILSDFGYLEARTASLGLNGLLIDLRGVIRAQTFVGEDSSVPQALLRVLQREAAHLSGWDRTRRPGFFAQQVLNRARDFDLDSLANAAEQQLTDLKAPYLVLQWRMRDESAALEQIRPGDGTRIQAIAMVDDGRVVYSVEDGVLAIWNPETREDSRIEGRVSPAAEPGRKGHPADHVIVTGDGRRAISVSDLGTRVWDLERCEEIFALQGNRGVVGVFPDGNRAVSDRGDHLAVWDLETGCEEQQLPVTAPLTGLAVVAGGTRVLGWRADGSVVGWNVATGSGEEELVPAARDCTGAAASADGKHVLRSFKGGTIRAWNVDMCRPGAELRGHTQRVSGMAVLSDARCAVSGSADGTLRLWNIDSGQCLQVMEAPPAAGHGLSARRSVTRAGPVCGVAVASDGTRAVTAAGDGAIRMWSLGETGRLLAQARGPHDRCVNDIKVTATGKQAVTASADGSLAVWDLATRKILRQLPRDGLGVALLSDDTQAVSGSSNGDMILWDLATGKSRQVIRAHQAAVWMVAAHGSRVASASKDGTVKLWDLATGAVLRELRGHDGDVVGLTFSPDGHILFSCGRDGTVRAWNSDTGEPLWVGRGHQAPALTVSATPDGKHVISGDRSGVLKVWNVSTGAEVRALIGHTGHVWNVVATSDSQRVISVSWDSTFRVWDLPSGQEIAVMPVDVRGVSIALLDSDSILAGDYEGGIYSLRMPRVPECEQRTIS